MTFSTYEPPPLEIGLTLGLGTTVLSPYYRRYARDLALRGDERVLDFGSGSGILARHVAAQLRNGGHIDCVDVSHGWQTVIRRTLRRFDNVGYRLGHITQIDLPDATYDLALCHFVLHEIPPAERPLVVAALARKLKPGGCLILREPQNKGLTSVALERLAADAGLRLITFDAHAIPIGPVYDACFTR